MLIGLLGRTTLGDMLHAVSKTRKQKEKWHHFHHFFFIPPDVQTQKELCSCFSREVYVTISELTPSYRCRHVLVLAGRVAYYAPL